MKPSRVDLILLNTLKQAIVFSKTNECVDPLSNHTSTMSLSFSKSSELYFTQNFCGSSANQQSDPSFRKSLLYFQILHHQLNIFCFFINKIGKGTPQTSVRNTPIWSSFNHRFNCLYPWLIKVVSLIAFKALS